MRIDMYLPDLAADDANWRDSALCAQTDPEEFFPDKGGGTRQAGVCQESESRCFYAKRVDGQRL